MTTSGAGPAEYEPMRLADAIKIQEYLEHLTVTGYPKTTVDTYRCALRAAARNLPAGLGGSYPEELAAWLATLTRGTQLTYGSALRGFYAHHRRTGAHVGDDPTAELPRVRRPRRLPRPVEHDQLARILTYASQPVRRWATIAAYCGARCCEIARLDRGDITEQSTYLHGKGDADRLVPTHPDVWAAVRDLPPGLLAGGRSPHEVSRLASKEFRRLGLAGIGMHRLRHWYGTHIQAAAGNTRVTQDLLGHASLANTQIYTAVSDVAMRAAVLGLPRLNGASGDAAAA